MHTTTCPLRTVMAASLRVWKVKNSMGKKKRYSWKEFCINGLAIKCFLFSTQPVGHIMQFMMATVCGSNLKNIICISSKSVPCTRPLQSKRHAKHFITVCLSALSTFGALWQDTSVTEEWSARDKWSVLEWRGRTHQNDLLYVFGRAPVKHPSWVIFLYVLIHALNLLAAWDEERVVSNWTKRKEKENSIFSHTVATDKSNQWRK